MRREILRLAAFVVMFWNVENFFDPFDDPLKNDNEYTAQAVTHWTWGRFERKRDLIGKTIIASASATGDLPAIVGLAEVENRLTVRQIATKSPLAELGYGYIHRESPDQRGIDVALLYRKDLFRPIAVDSLRVVGFDTRDILYVKGLVTGGISSASACGRYGDGSIGDGPGGEIVSGSIGDGPGGGRVSDINREETGGGIGSSGIGENPGGGRVSDGLIGAGDTLHIFVNHWPSKRGGAAKSQPRRDSVRALLTAFCDSILTADPCCRIIAMGDFNDTDPEAPPLHRCTPVPPAAFTGTTQTTADCQAAGDCRTDAGSRSSTAAGTLKYRGRWETIDHFFVSDVMSAARTAKPASAAARAVIFAPGFLLEADKSYLGVKPRRTYIGPRYNGGVSDHLPILLKISLCGPTSSLRQQPDGIPVAVQQRPDSNPAATSRSSGLLPEGAGECDEILH